MTEGRVFVVMITFLAILAGIAIGVGVAHLLGEPTCSVPCGWGR